MILVTLECYGVVCAMATATVLAWGWMKSREIPS
jgi:hypothetical protein